MKLYQRGADGFPIGSDKVMRDFYGPIPNSTRFQSNDSYRYEKPLQIHGWQWSTTFNRWSALVEFENGWTGFTWPEPERKIK